MKKLIASLVMVAQFFYSSAQTCYPLDTSFGVAGKAIGLNSTNWIACTNMVVQPDNKILQFSARDAEFIVIRYKANGSLDSSFGQNGRTSVGIAVTNICYGALQTDGKIVIAGYGRPITSSYNTFIVVRLNASGSIDNSFGTGGIVYMYVGSNNNNAHGVTIQPDGKILVVGESGGNCFNDCYNHLLCRPLITLVRYNTNGSPDFSFGQGGYLTTGIGSSESGSGSVVSIQSNGKIVVAGEIYRYYCDDYYGGSYYTAGFFMRRFQTNGAPDSSFGLNGQVVDTLVQGNVLSFTILPDGKFLTAGDKFGGGSIVRRYLANGNIDNSFNQVTNPDVVVNSMVVLPNGKIVVGGTMTETGQNRFYIARLNSDGSTDSSFNIVGNLVIRVASSLTNSENHLTGLALQGNQIIAGGTSQTNTTGSYSDQQLVLRLPDSIKGFNVAVTPHGKFYPCTGTSMTFSTSVQGSYQWYNNGLTISGATSASYIAPATNGRYAVRVNNTNGCGLSDEVVTSVNGLPVYVIIGGSLNICKGDSVMLKSSETTGSLQWYRIYQQNIQLISGATDSIYWVKQIGSYLVKVNNSKGCGSSNYAYVNVNSGPPISWDGNFLSTTSGYTGYQWYFNGNAIPGATTPYYQPNSLGIYKVAVSNFACDPTSEDFNLNCVQVNVPKPVVSWSGVHLITSNGFTSYQWYFNNNPVAGAIGNAVTATQTGIYRVDITGKFNCPNSSNDFDLNCNVVGPSKPIIYWNGVKFSVGVNYSYYQWYFNDSAIIGATASSYTPPPNKFGSYKVEVGNDYNCKIFSDSKYYAPTATVVIGQAKVSYYPNPANNVFYIDVSQPSLKQMNIVLYDLNGKLLLRKTLKAGQNQIPVHELSAGLYQLEINCGTEKLSLKLNIVR